MGPIVTKATSIKNKNTIVIQQLIDTGLHPVAPRTLSHSLIKRNTYVCVHREDKCICINLYINTYAQVISVLPLHRFKPKIAEA